MPSTKTLRRPMPPKPLAPHVLVLKVRSAARAAGAAAATLMAAETKAKSEARGVNIKKKENLRSRSTPPPWPVNKPLAAAATWGREQLSLTASAGHRSVSGIDLKLASRLRLAKPMLHRSKLLESTRDVLGVWRDAPRTGKATEAGLSEGWVWRLGLHPAAWFIHLLPSTIQIVARQAWPTSRR